MSNKTGQTTLTAEQAKKACERVMMLQPVRKEAHSRRSFAEDKGRFYYEKMKHILNNGNIFNAKATMKYLQARRIYVHYTNEYQQCQGLPLTK